jgi:hypothetical protein
LPSNSIASAPGKPYLPQYTLNYRESPSYGVQTGYEGYLIPAPVPDATDSDEEGGLLSKILIGDLNGGHWPKCWEV